MINSKDEFIRKLNILRPEDAEDMAFCIQQLDSIRQGGEVSEESLQTMYNVISLLTLMKERHMVYIITWLKQGFMEAMDG